MKKTLLIICGCLLIQDSAIARRDKNRAQTQYDNARYSSYDYQYEKSNGRKNTRSSNRQQAANDIDDSYSYQPDISRSKNTRSSNRNRNQPNRYYNENDYANSQQYSQQQYASQQYQESVSQQFSVKLENWMTCLWSLIKDLPLNQIKFVGTHDSGTGVISKDNAIVSSDGRTPGIAKLAPSKIVSWSQTQDLTISQQLKIGVRYLDFRVSKEPKGLFLSHGLRGENLRDVLSGIASFVRRNPKEFLVIKIKGFPDKKISPKNDVNYEIATLFEQMLGNHLLPSSALRKPLPMTSLRELVEGAGKNIAVLWETKVKEKDTNRDMLKVMRQHPWLLSAGENIESPWGNTPSSMELVSYTLDSAKRVDPNKLYALHWTLTANPKYILGHLMTDGIKQMNAKLDKIDIDNVLSKISFWNIVEADFVTPQFVKRIISYNANDPKSISFVE